MKHLVLLLFVAAAVAKPAMAEQYWVAWEGNDYPENEGWERWNHDPDWVADRSISDGIMTLDGMSSIEITDGYRMQRSVNPAPGEQFVAQWRLRVNEVGNQIWPYDPGWTLTSDDGWHVAIVIGVDELHSILEHQYLSFEPMEFHEWEFRSSDMRSYTLYLDGIVAQTGMFTYTGVDESRVLWGDIVYGSNSNSDWDYFRYGVMPEPSSCVLLLAWLCAARAFKQKQRSNA